MGILAASSNFFNTLLKEFEDNELIMLPEFPADEVKDLLDFLYGRSSEKKSELHEVFKLGSYCHSMTHMQGKKRRLLQRSNMNDSESDDQRYEDTDDKDCEEPTETQD